VGASRTYTIHFHTASHALSRAHNLAIFLQHLFPALIRHDRASTFVARASVVCTSFNQKARAESLCPRIEKAQYSKQLLGYLQYEIGQLCAHWISAVIRAGVSSASPDGPGGCHPAGCHSRCAFARDMLSEAMMLDPLVMAPNFHGLTT
jgi:hypothetical protein